MNHRTIPYGYRFEMGKPVPHPAESLTVGEIFADYIAGKSLKVIADHLTASKTEYLPGASQWDKARVKRLLENRKYIGEDGYPPLIPLELFDEAQSARQTANTNKLPRDAELEVLKPYLVCDSCGEKLHRKYDSRLTIATAWKCESCGHAARIADETLKAEVLAEINAVITAPSLADLPEEAGGELFSLEARRIEQDFHRALDSGNADEDELLNMILECAAKNYESISGARHISDRLTADFSKRSLLSSIDKELLEKAVKHIRLTANGEVKLELQNGKIITRK